LRRGDDNYDRLLHCVCLYNSVIASDKLEKAVEVIEYMKQFIILARDLSESLLDVHVFRQLAQAKRFDMPKNIEDFLKNSKAIFSAVYGESHPFVQTGMK
jgi:hypothetical protein